MLLSGAVQALQWRLYQSNLQGRGCWRGIEWWILHWQRRWKKYMHFLSPRLLPLSSGNSNKSLKNLNQLLKRHAFFKLTHLRLLDTICLCSWIRTTVCVGKYCGHKLMYGFISSSHMGLRNWISLSRWDGRGFELPLSSVAEVSWLNQDLLDTFLFLCCFALCSIGRECYASKYLVGTMK